MKIFGICERYRSRHKFGGTKVCKAGEVRKYFVNPYIAIYPYIVNPYIIHTPFIVFTCNKKRACEIVSKFKL